jgi:hypothetical protein
MMKTECNATHEGKIEGGFKEEMEKKVTRAQYIKNMDRQLISEEDTFLWPPKGDLKGENESEIVAAEDQALNTK